ncbi:hypothetical protein RJT34_20140 [Clitoria ternatea]|uniref:Uncharacterized protein n=1 Tax=Clitoria ternatea TaxID=43366 RepID=A0AAN9ISN1_CLITE
MPKAMILFSFGHSFLSKLLWQPLTSKDLKAYASFSISSLTFVLPWRLCRGSQSPRLLGIDLEESMNCLNRILSSNKDSNFHPCVDDASPLPLSTPLPSSCGGDTLR